MTDSTIPALKRRKRALPQVLKLAQLAALRSQMWLMSHATPDRAATRLAGLFTTPPQPQVRPWERAAMAQARYTRERFGALGFLSVYRWFGDSDKPRPRVLLMHGFGGRSSQLSGFALPLVEAGYDVVAFDGPAHGQSGQARTALPEFVDAIEAFAEREGTFDVVIGHSMGAAALATAMRRGMAVNRAILIAPPTYPGTYLSQAGRILGASEKVIGRTQALIEGRYGRAFDEFRTPLNASVLTQPALIVHDRNDRQVALAEGQKTADAWSGARMEITEGLGHTRILQDPGTIAMTQSFLMETA